MNILFLTQASGWLLVTASLAFSYTKPIQEMAPQRPLGSLFHPSIVVSVAGQGLIHVLCMRMAVKLSTERMGDAALKAVVLFQKKARAGELAGDVDEDDCMEFGTLRQQEQAKKAAESAPTGAWGKK